MRHIHPFPARMAPEIALSKIKLLSSGQKVLDPMAGSGMVLGQAAKNGFESIGYDLDPLARMIASTGATKVNAKGAIDALNMLLDRCIKCKRKRLALAWIDDDKKTSDFIDFWFYLKQQKQLRLLSFYLLVEPIVKNKKILDIIKIAISRLIVTKEPKASLARDTAHSRPHRTILKNDYDIFEELPRSLLHVIGTLDSPSIQIDTKTYLGDARKMTKTRDCSIDAIITSPPYLNAIDYMRGHRLSLVWFGYNMEQLRKIRNVSIGTEKTNSDVFTKIFLNIANGMDIQDLDSRNKKMLNRYFLDLTSQLSESFRVLKHGGSAVYVIGNSTIRGCYIHNNEFLKKAGSLAGFELNHESVRDIPDNRRYLPIAVKPKNTLSSRMRTEHIVEFIKPNPVVV